jgi:hypothetical protein
MSQEMGGSQWQFDMQMLRQLEAKCEDAELQVACDVWCAARVRMVTPSQRKWLDVKFLKKQALAVYLKRTWGFDVDPTTMFDMHIKRIHE